MKKLFLLASAAIIAQTASAQFSIAPEAGLVMSGQSMKVLGEKVDTKMKIGFRVGGNVDYAISDAIHIQGGIFYAAKGSKAKEGDGKVAVNYLEVPIYVNYMTGEAGGNRFFGGVGPYLGYAFGGKVTDATGEERDLEIGSDEGKSDIKALDLGLNVNIGYMLSNGLYVRANYGLGLTNLIPGGDGDNSVKNNGFAISFGYYLFGNNRGE